jgi:hypothetical protein
MWNMSADHQEPAKAFLSPRRSLGPAIITGIMACESAVPFRGRLRVGKRNLHVAGLVGAAMCSAFRCGSHDRWP